MDNTTVMQALNTHRYLQCTKQSPAINILQQEVVREQACAGYARPNTLRIPLLMLLL
jgi:hypothetical protein